MIAEGAPTEQIKSSYEFEEGGIRIFGARGIRLSEDRRLMNALGGDQMIEVIRDNSTRNRIGWCIAQARTYRGWDDDRTRRSMRVAQIQISAHAAVSLYLDGVLTPDHLVDAIESPDYIDIPYGRFSDGLTIRVLPNKTEITAADARGNVLYDME